MIGALVGVKHQSRAFSRWPPSPCHRRRSAQRSVFARISRVIPPVLPPGPARLIAHTLHILWRARRSIAGVGILTAPWQPGSRAGGRRPATPPRRGAPRAAPPAHPPLLLAVAAEARRRLRHFLPVIGPTPSRCPPLPEHGDATGTLATGTLASGTPAPAGISEKGGAAAPSIRGATSRRGRGRIEPRAHRRFSRGTGDAGLRPLLWDRHFARPGPYGLFDQDRVAGADSSGSTARLFLRPRSLGEPGWLDEHRPRRVPAPALDRPPHFNEHFLDHCVHLVVELASICMARDILIRCRGVER